jgi:hypothetical protein
MSEFDRTATWILKHERLPDTCLSCGMFTDHRVTARAVQQQQRSVPVSETNSQLAMGCLLQLLGPVGWILAAILQSGRDSQAMTEKTVTLRGKIRIPCCRLCSGQTAPQPVEADIPAGRYAFDAHFRFVERLRTLRDEAEQES